MSTKYTLIYILYTNLYIRCFFNVFYSGLAFLKTIQTIQLCMQQVD